VEKAVTRKEPSDMISSFSSSLQRKFILIAVVSVTCLTLAMGLFAAARTKAALFNATKQKGQMLAQTVSALIINEFIYEKLGLVEEGGLIDNYVRELYQRDELDLEYVAVLDNNFQVVSHSDFSEFGKVYQNPFKVGGIHEQDDLVIVEKKNQQNKRSELEFAIPLSIEGKRWGTLQFAMYLESVERESRNVLVQIMSLTFLALVFLVMLIYFLSQRFIRPITLLSQAMAEVEVGMVEKTIPVRGTDELSQLTESYNEMVRRIRQANEDMKITHEKLLNSEKLATLGVLSSSVAHRINNPLGGLFNCVKMLQKKGEDTAFREKYLSLIEEGLDSIEETVGQLLWTAGKREGEEKVAHVATILSGVVTFLDYRLRKQNIVYSEQVDSDLYLAVAPHDLEEMFLNTMINAIQAMGKGGNLTVSAQGADGKAVLKIQDTGVGIPADQLDKVFDLFYSTKKAGEGTGLGMWMTYELVAKYKGKIQLSSQVGQGTLVTIILPEAR
jgi:signal transduction histidine kinase